MDPIQGYFWKSKPRAPTDDMIRELIEKVQELIEELQKGRL